MFADDTNLFFTHKDIIYLFQIVNQELEDIKTMVYFKQISKKQNSHFFHKSSQKENIPLLLPKLIINNYEIQRTEPIMFWGFCCMKT